jgi:hypothetical protein
MSTLQYVFLGVGGLALLAGLAMLVQRVRTIVSGRKVDAKVVDEKVSISRNKNGKEIRVCTPVFEFVHEGKTYRCQSTLGSSGTGHPRGSTVKVRYLPNDPQSTAEIDTFFAFFGFPLVAFVFGAALIWVALEGGK